MKSKKYLEFKEKYLEECIAACINEYDNQWRQQIEELKKEIRQQLKQVIANMIVIQEQVPVKVGCIQISLLASSLQKDCQEIMYEVYDDRMDFGKVLYAQTYQLEGLLPIWTEIKPQIEKKIAELNWQSYLGKAAVQALRFELIDTIIIALAYFLKYEFDDFMEGKNEKNLQKAKGFYLSAGEYRGWRKVLYQYTEVVDIFAQRHTKEFPFMRFLECHYVKKRFVSYKLPRTKFKNCVFKNTVFLETDLQDAEFEDCVFRECVFEKCLLNGCLFIGCDMQRIEWKENQMKKGLYINNGVIEDMFRESGFIESILYRNTFLENEMEDCIRISCDEKEIIEEER